MALFDTSGGLGGLLGDLGDYGFGVPKNTGLIADVDRDAINKRALLSGLISAGLTYAATPKNLNTGSALPYLGKAGLAGFNTSQDVVDRALNTAYRNQILSARDDKLYNVDGALVDKAGNVVYQSPTKGKSNIGTVNPSDVTPASLAKFAVTGNYGDLRFIKPTVAEKEPKPPTEEQSKARTFYKRMEGATKVFNKPAVDAQGKPIINPDGTPLTIEQVAGKPEIGAEILGSIPLIGGVAKRGAESTNRQLYRQAQENWVTANLRKESGAVIGPVEMQQEIVKYFPQINEGPEVIAQKAEARRIAEEGMKLNANFPTEKQPKQEQQAQQKRVVRTGKDKSGKTVFQYSDGSIGYGD